MGQTGPTGLNKSPIKKAMQYYSGWVVKPDKTKLGSTKPNRCYMCFSGRGMGECHTSPWPINHILMWIFERLLI